jgi:hypothetical protein
MPTDPEHGGWPDEYFLDGPAPGGEELLRRTVATVHRKSARAARARRHMLIGVLVVVAGLLTGLGMAIGRWTLGESLRPIVVASDVSTGASLAVTMGGTEGGSYLDVTVTGLPVGTNCWLTVTSRDGHTLAGGSFQIEPDAQRAPVDFTIWLPPAEVAEIAVTASTGAQLIGAVKE